MKAKAKHISGPVYEYTPASDEKYLGSTLLSNGDKWDWYECKGIATVLFARYGSERVQFYAIQKELKPSIMKVLRKPVL